MVAMNITTWHTLIEAVVTRYNNDIHSTIQMTPLQAIQPENFWGVMARIEMKAMNNRTYPELNVGDTVKIIRKPGKYGEFKAGFVNWSMTVHAVEETTYRHGSRMYKVSDRDRPLLRHELLKVEGVERAPAQRLSRKSRPEELFRRMVGG